MVAPRKAKKIFCTVIRVTAADDTCMRTNNPRFTDSTLQRSGLETRPSDLLPWADPYIARLVSKLQEEVRVQRMQTSLIPPVADSCLAELEPPSPRTDHDWEWQDEPRWSQHEEI